MSMAAKRESIALARTTGLSPKTMYRLMVLKKNGCPELVHAAHAGLLAPKHSEIIAKALNHHDQRLFLANLPYMTPRQQHNALAAMRNQLKAQKAGGVSNG